MELCEMCEVNYTEKKFKIPLSHPFSDVPTIRWLCRYCYEDLRKNSVKLVEVMD